jgi:hypothetical protein
VVFFRRADATEKTKKPTAVLNIVEEEAKAMVYFQAQLLWLKEFVDSNPSVNKVAEMELRYANGRVKEAFQAWSTNRILPLAHVWRKLLPHGNNSSIRMKSWVKELSGKRPKAHTGIQTGLRFKEGPTAVTEAFKEGVMNLRVRRGKQRNPHRRHLTKHFLQASLNRDKRKRSSTAACPEGIVLL